MDVVIFDGICRLCTHSVTFILKHEAEPRFQFAAVQSAAGTRLLSELGFNSANPSTFVLISEGRVYTKSAAAVRIARHLKGAWRFAVLFWLVPRPLRDWIYDAVARSRYRWFGKTDTCMMPTPDIAARFLRD